jgi:hypothetical protein
MLVGFYDVGFVVGVIGCILIIGEV